MKSLLSSAFALSLLSLVACGADEPGTPLVIPPAPQMSEAMPPLVVGKAEVVVPPVVVERPVVSDAKAIVPKTADDYIDVARGHIDKNERQAALMAARKAVKLAPKSSRAYNTLGRAELLRHSYDAAIVAFTRSTELDANNVWAWNNLGFVHLTLERYTDAAAALREATTRPGASGFMFNNLGTAYEHLDELDAAREAYEHGGALGSVAAAQSRDRLEGVETIATASWPTRPDATVKPTDYELREEATVDEVPDPMEPADDVEVDDPTAPLDQT